MLDVNKDMVNQYNNGAKTSSNYGLKNEGMMLGDIRKILKKKDSKEPD